MKSDGGYTLIEVLISLAILSILLLAANSMFFSGLTLWNNGEEKLDSIQNARYAIDMIAREIKSAEKIIDVEMISGLDNAFPNNFGFVAQLKNKRGKYTYALYYLDTSEGKVKRVAGETDSPDIYPESRNFRGFNEVAQYIISNDGSNFNSGKRIINIRIKAKHGNDGEFIYENKVSIRCPIDV